MISMTKLRNLVQDDRGLSTVEYVILLVLFALRGQIASGINLIVQTSRQSDGRRGITQVTHVHAGSANDGYHLEDLFVRDEGGSLRSPDDSQCNTPAISPAQRLAFRRVANGLQQRAKPSPGKV